LINTNSTCKYLKELERDINKDYRNNKVNGYEDNGRFGSTQDVYTSEELIEISTDYFKGSIQANSHKAHRDTMVFLMNHFMLLRGETSRFLSFNHLFCQTYLNEGPSPCPVLIMTTVVIS
jgi:hypothetical protein